MKYNRNSLAGVLPSILISLLIALAAHAEQTNTAKAPAKSSATLPRVGVKELLSNPTNYEGKQIVLEGFVTDICKKKGCWAMLHDADPDAKGQVRVKQDDDASSFKAFLPEIQGKTVLVTGEVHETRIDAEYLDKWEARVKEAQKDKAKAKEQEEPNAAVFKQIAGLRERVAKSKQGYLTSLGVAVLTWEAKTPKP
jgi:hypothetical protein